jgi:electron transfer flavoprotein alpha subunit
MAIDLFSGATNSPISADLMYRYYDNKAITPQIRSALQKKENDFLKENDSSNSSSTASKSGPAARLSITDQIIRMNIANNSKKTEKEGEAEKETSEKKKPSRYDVLTEVKKNVAEREAAAKKEKDAQLQEIKDKIAAAEAAKKEEEAAGTASP